MARLTLETSEILGRGVDEDVLVDDMVARKQHTDGGGERQPAVAALGRETFVAKVGSNTARQVVRIAERMQAQSLVPDTHLVRTKRNVLQADLIIIAEREVSFQDPGTVRRTDDLLICQPLQPDKPALADDTLELLAALQKPACGIPVLHLLRDDEPAREGVERTGRAAVLTRGLRQEQIAGMAYVGTFVEVTLERPCEEAHIVTARGGRIALFEEPVLLVDDRKGGQDRDGLDPRRMDSLVLGGRDGKKLGESNAIADREVGILRDDTAVLDTKQRELTLQRGAGQSVSHKRDRFAECRKSRPTRRRLMM